MNLLGEWVQITVAEPSAAELMEAQGLKSTGIGTYANAYEITVRNDCTAERYSYGREAHCNSTYGTGLCPLGWGSLYLLDQLQPGCCFGTYYPNPIPGGNFSHDTGSLLQSSIR